MKTYINIKAKVLGTMIKNLGSVPYYAGTEYFPRLGKVCALTEGN